MTLHAPFGKKSSHLLAAAVHHHDVFAPRHRRNFARQPPPRFGGVQQRSAQLDKQPHRVPINAIRRSLDNPASGSYSGPPAPPPLSPACRFRNLPPPAPFSRHNQPHYP